MILTKDDIFRKSETAGQTALRHYCEAMEQGRTPDKETLQFLFHAFEKIRNGANPKKALLLETRRGRKNTMAEIERKLPAAEEVYRQMQGGKPYLEAVFIAAEKLGLSDKTVKRHYSACKDFLPDRILSQIMAPITQLNEFLEFLARNKKLAKK